MLSNDIAQLRQRLYRSETQPTAPKSAFALNATFL